MVTVLTRMNDHLQQNPYFPEIRYPVLPSETFNRHWDQGKYANFRNTVHSHALTARNAKAESSNERSIKV